MEEPKPTSKSPDSSEKTGLPLWTLLVGLLIVAVIGVASLGAVLYFTRSDKARLERQLRDFETRQAQDRLNEKKAAEDAKLALARNHQDQVLAQARASTNVLFQLLNDVQAVAGDATALRTNDAGKRISLYPELVAQARRLYETELGSMVSADEVITKLEGVRRVEQQVIAAAGSTFEPAADMLVTAQNAGLWAEPERRKVSQIQSMLTALVRESKVKITGGPVTAQTPSLEDAIRQMAQAEVVAQQRVILQKTSEAKSEGVAAVAQAEADKVLEQAKAKAAQIVADAKEIAAKAQREDLVRQASAKVEDSKAVVAAQQKLDEATRTQLRQRASDPAVQAVLAPFITPGMWTPAAGTGLLRNIEKKPMSLSEIQAAGALNPDSRGLHALVRIACYIRNDRPRWDDVVGHNQNTSLFLRDPQKVALAAERQKIFIEVAPVLVEMKLLEP